MKVKWAIQCLESCAHKLTSRQQEAVQTLKATAEFTRAVLALDAGSDDALDFSAKVAALCQEYRSKNRA